MRTAAPVHFLSGRYENHSPQMQQEEREAHRSQNATEPSLEQYSPQISHLVSVARKFKKLS